MVKKPSHATVPVTVTKIGKSSFFAFLINHTFFVFAFKSIFVSFGEKKMKIIQKIGFGTTSNDYSLPVSIVSNELSFMLYK